MTESVEPPANKHPRFRIREDGKIIGIPYGEQPLAKPFHVRFPQDVDSVVRSMDNKQQFIRDAVIEKLKKEGYLEG